MFVEGEHTDFKFGVQVDYIKSQCPQISLEWLKLETSNIVRWLAMSSIILQIDK